MDTAMVCRKELIVPDDTVGCLIPRLGYLCLNLGIVDVIGMAFLTSMQSHTNKPIGGLGAISLVGDCNRDNCLHSCYLCNVVFTAVGTIPRVQCRRT